MTKQKLVLLYCLCGGKTKEKKKVGIFEKDRNFGNFDRVLIPCYSSIVQPEQMPHSTSTRNFLQPIISRHVKIYCCSKEQGIYALPIKAELEASSFEGGILDFLFILLLISF